LGQAGHLRTDGNAPFLQRFDGNLVTLAHLAENVRVYAADSTLLRK
jgi:hypothetical protein